MRLDRRSLLVGASLTAGAATLSNSAQARIPDKEFLWGTAGAAYQVEGGNYASDVWLLEHVKPTLYATPSGDADDTYNRVEEDIALAASLGFNSHRLSIEWSRIEPENGQVSEAAIAYYRKVLESCRRHGLAPVVSYTHNAIPRWFAAGGGFSTRDGIAPFVRYCEMITQRMGDLIAVGTTFNEPNIHALLSWIPEVAMIMPVVNAMNKAAAAASGSPKWASLLFDMSPDQQAIMIEAHSRAYDAIKKAAAKDFPVGVTLSINQDIPAGPDSAIDAKREQVVMPWLNAPADMVGIQTYTTARVGAKSDLPFDKSVETTQMGYPYAPQALEAVIRMVAGLTKRPLYVTENGIATEDDTRRIAFIKEAVSGVLRCKAEGIDLRSYIHWALLDNWEWLYGYRPKFGLVAVDRKTFERKPKPSATYFGRIARTGKVA